MKRRRFVQALAGGSAAQVLLAQQPAANQSAPGVPLNPAQGVQPPPNAANQLPKLKVSVPDIAADPMPRFFSQTQFSTLQKVSSTLTPGALEARTPEFLDFLLSESPADRQRVYREGLDSLNSQSNRKFGKEFAALDEFQIAAMLVPLRQPWNYDEPADPAARFLRVAKVDVRTATLNSADYSAGRRFSGTGQYWYPLD